MDEERFRAMVDSGGLLREGAYAPPPRDQTYTVFAQRDDARVDLPTLQRHAARFFEADLGLSVEKRYTVDAALPEVDIAHLILASKDGMGGARLCCARPTTPEDLAAADRADLNAGYTGLAILAQRCRYIWQVVVENADDRVALRIAAILASVVLGPILPPDGTALFGVRTARLKLEQRATPFR